MSLRSAWPFAAGLAAYVALSSFLGLSGGEPWQVRETARFVAQVWSASPFADFLFIVGSVLTGVVAYRWSRRHHLVRAVLVGLLGTAATYLAGYVFLIATPEFGSQPPQRLLFPLSFGWMGVVFATLMPVLAAKPWSGARWHGVPPAGA